MSTRPLPLILDFDDSVLKFSRDETRISLHSWQEHIRLGCTKRQLASLEKQLKFLEVHDCVFLGSGDYHHMSLPFLKIAAKKTRKFDVIVCDNHPDNMRYPFGIHCSSWIYHASKLPQIECIHVIGITSDNITAKSCWENYWMPLMRGKVMYWSVSKKAHWLNLIGAGKAHRSFDTPDALIGELTAYIANTRHIYLSIDKDVLGTEVVETNWDQGCFAFEHIEELITVCRDRLIGVDVTGEISSYRFRGWFKRILNKLDDVEETNLSNLIELQKKHREVNEKIVELLKI